MWHQVPVRLSPTTVVPHWLFSMFSRGFLHNLLLAFYFVLELVVYILLLINVQQVLSVHSTTSSILFCVKMGSMKGSNIACSRQLSYCYMINQSVKMFKPISMIRRGVWLFLGPYRYRYLQLTYIREHLLPLICQLYKLTILMTEATGLKDVEWCIHMFDYTHLGKWKTFRV